MDSQSATPQEVADVLVHTFCHEIIDCNGLLLLSTKQARNAGKRVIDDPVGYESTMNKRYVTDLSRIDENARDALMTIGRAVIRIWAERIALLLPGRNVVFYLGGLEDVVLRFHVRRPGICDWTDLADREFLKQSKLEAYVLQDGNLARS
jgi:hypothetical protein